MLCRDTSRTSYRKQILNVVLKCWTRWQPELFRNRLSKGISKLRFVDNDCSMCWVTAYIPIRHDWLNRRPGWKQIDRPKATIMPAVNLWGHSQPPPHFPQQASRETASLASRCCPKIVGRIWFWQKKGHILKKRKYFPQKLREIWGSCLMWI